MMEIDASGLDVLAREFADAEPTVQREMPRIMRKAGVNVKSDWQQLGYGSLKVPPDVSFDENTWFGAVYEVEVGPTPGDAGSLAGIYHFGGANGGGGSGGDPSRFAEAEEPRMEAAMLDLIDRVLG